MPPDGFFKNLFSHRTPEVWAALVGGCLYVWQKSPSISPWARAVEAGISGLIGYSLGEDAAEWAGVSPKITTFILTAMGYLFLDGVRALVADRSVLKEVILKFLGGTPNGK